jgi:hypothetical protein
MEWKINIDKKDKELKVETDELTIYQTKIPL